MNLQEYERLVHLRYKPSTAYAYSRSLSRFADWLAAEPDVATASNVQEYLSELTKKISPRSISRHAFALKDFFDKSGRKEMAEEIPVPRFEMKPPRVLKEEEIQKLIEAPSNLHDKLVLWTAYECALRLNEVTLLNRQNIDQEGKVIWVHRGKRRGISSHPVPVSQALLSAIDEYLTTRTDEQEALFVTSGGRGGVHFRRITRDAVRTTFERASRKIGLEAVSFHVIRHTRCTVLAVHGMDIMDIAKIAGHSRLDTTMIYLHLTSVDLRKRMLEKGTLG